MIKHLPPWIGELIRNQSVKSLGSRPVAENTGVVQPAGAVGRLNLRVEEGAFHEIYSAAGPPSVVVDGVLDVLGSETMQYRADLVSLVITVRIFGVDDIRNLGNVGASVPQGKNHGSC